MKKRVYHQAAHQADEGDIARSKPLFCTCRRLVLLLLLLLLLSPVELVFVRTVRETWNSLRWTKGLIPQMHLKKGKFCL